MHRGIVSDGSIQGVGETFQRRVKLRKEGIDIFVVPKVNYDEALRFARGAYKIIGVRLSEGKQFCSLGPRTQFLDTRWHPAFYIIRCVKWRW